MSTTRPEHTSVSLKSKKDSIYTLSTLHSYLEVIFTKFDRENRGSVKAKDLFPILDFFEREQGVALLDFESKRLLQKFCVKNAELQLSIEDLYILISQLSVPSISSSITLPSKIDIENKHGSTLSRLHPCLPLASRQETPVLRTLSTSKVAEVFDKNFNTCTTSTLSGLEELDANSFCSSARDPIKPYRSVYLYEQLAPRFTREPLSWNRNFIESCNGDISDYPNIFEKNNESLGTNFKETTLQIENLSRISSELNNRLRQTEKNFTFSVRLHEERIAELQIQVDDMKVELTAKRRELQEYKSNERSHLQQICMLEAEIVSISRTLSHHKNLYNDLRQQYDEKREEIKTFRSLLKSKEEELLKSGIYLGNYTLEQKKYQQERSAFEIYISNLEQEILFAQTLEHEVDELREDNQHLRDAVNHLRQDLDDAIKGSNTKTRRDIAKDLQSASDVVNEKNLQLELSLVFKDQDNAIHFGPQYSSDYYLTSSELDFESYQYSQSYIAFLKNQNHFFKIEAEEASRKLENAVNHLKETRETIAFDRKILQEEINRLRNIINSHETQETEIQYDFTHKFCTIARNMNSPENAINRKSSSPCLEPELIRKEGLHQNLELEYQKSISDFKAQENKIQELLAKSDSCNHTSQVTTTPTGVPQRISAPRQNSTNYSYGVVGNSSEVVIGTSSLGASNIAPASKTRGVGAATVILYTLVVYILGIVTIIFIQQPILDHMSKQVDNTNKIIIARHSEHQSSQNEQQQPRTRPLDYLVYWFQALAQGDELIQVPT